MLPLVVFLRLSSGTLSASLFHWFVFSVYKLLSRAETGKLVLQSDPRTQKIWHLKQNTGKFRMNQGHQYHKAFVRYVPLLQQLKNKTSAVLIPN